MDQFWHALFVYVHILGVVLFVGPQIFLAFAWVPASRRIEDSPTRIAAMRIVTRRFLYIGGIGLLLAILAGSYLIATWRSYYGVPDDVGFTSLRFGVVFVVKMVLLLAMLAAVGIHSFVTGPKLIDLLERQPTTAGKTSPEARSLRLQSMALSIAGLLLALVMMSLGVLLNTTQWSLQ